MQLMKSKNIILFLIFYILLFILAQLPIWLNEFLPLQDYPNHLARMQIIMSIKDDPLLQSYYQVKFSIIPNLAMDIIVPALANFFGLEFAGKLMIALTFFIITSGGIFLNYVLFRAINFWSLTTFILLFNQAFIKGFLNFLFGIGLALWCIGLWILIRENKAWLKLVLFTFLNITLFICHLYAFCFYAITIVSYEVQSIVFASKKLKKSDLIKKLSTICYQFTIPIILYLFSPTSESSLSLSYSPIITKVKYLKMKLSDNYNSSLDLAVVLFLIVIPLLGISSKKLSLNRSMIFSILALIVAYLLLPNTLSSSQNADWRLLIPLFLLILSSLKFNDNKVSNIAIATIFISIFSLRIFSINLEWHNFQSEYKEIVNAITYIDKGSRLFSARAYQSYYETLPFMYAPTYAVMKKSSFVPSLFAFETQQPVHFKPKYIELAKSTGKSVYSDGKGIDWNKIIKHYDYVLLAREDLFQDVPKSYLDKIFQGKYITLYKIDGL
jgi:hypothetical protein